MRAALRRGTNIKAMLVMAGGFVAVVGTLV